MFRSPSLYLRSSIALISHKRLIVPPSSPAFNSSVARITHWIICSSLVGLAVAVVVAGAP